MTYQDTLNQKMYTVRRLKKNLSHFTAEQLGEYNSAGLQYTL